MSNCCANSASVLSPRTAAKATFALKAGVWFRRGRLVIVSPMRHAYWPLSGRNSTYPDVQISRASSLAPGRAAQRAGIQCRAQTQGGGLILPLAPSSKHQQEARSGIFGAAPYT